MMMPEWDIHGPTDYAWTPAEVAQIARAAQAFLAALPNPYPSGGVAGLVKIHGIGVIDGETKVEWPQPNEGIPIDPTRRASPSAGEKS